MISSGGGRKIKTCTCPHDAARAPDQRRCLLARTAPSAGDAANGRARARGLGSLGETQRALFFQSSSLVALIFSPVISSQRLFYLSHGRCFCLLFGRRHVVSQARPVKFLAPWVSAPPPGRFVCPLHHVAAAPLYRRRLPLVSVASRIKNGHGE